MFNGKFIIISKFIYQRNLLDFSEKYSVIYVLSVFILFFIAVVVGVVFTMQNTYAVYAHVFKTNYNTK